MDISQTEENYLKAVFKVCERESTTASTNLIAAEMQTSAASVTDMIQRLSKKKLIHYKKHKGASLTDVGNDLATSLIRKHRLWEVFLVNSLSFSWDEVHDIAEQLEHIKSPELVERLDNFLGNPKFDPHGDPIPDSEGKFTFRKQSPLFELDVEETGVVVGVNDHTSSFLQFLDRMKLILGTTVKIVEKFEYDGSMRVRINEETEQLLSAKVSQNLFVKKT